MKKNFSIIFAVYFLVISGFLLFTVAGSHAVTVLAENQPVVRLHTVVIDPGHGGIDGGATSCTGVLESGINLEISLRLRDILHLLGIQTVMTRVTDTSIHTQGNTIAAQKMSDLKERAALVCNTEHALLVSIHQNTFSESRYYGAQVFYADDPQSKQLAGQLQTALGCSLNSGSNRKAKSAQGIYLMEHIDCTGVLIECGFLSNPEEEAKLRNAEYQRKLCCVIASSLSMFLHGNPS